MCDDHDLPAATSAPAALGRRELLLGAGALLSGAALGLNSRVASALVAARAAGPLSFGEVRPRSAWATAGPVGPLHVEDDVRFLLVHHAASSNTYAPSAVPSILRSFYALHIGPTRGWSDIAYNFLIDKYGVAWEGRQGSIAGAVVPDATGGSQGFSQLVCFIGNTDAVAPTPAAMTTAVRLLATLADRHRISTSPGAQTQFLSRGSNRWPAGTAVTARTISGHRDMSLTSCPGNAAYASIANGSLAAAVQQARLASTGPDIAVTGDWANVGVTGVGVVRGATWHLRDTPEAGAPSRSFRYGQPGDIPVVGRWVAGITGIGVRRGHTWHLRDSVSAGPADRSISYGAPGDIGVVGDWDGDGVDGIGVFRGRRWYLRNSATSGPGEIEVDFGRPGDIPVVGDWDGDGVDGIGVRRGRAWYLADLPAGPVSGVIRPTSVRTLSYGAAGDIGVVGDWDGDGQDEVGIIRGNVWHLDRDLTGGSGEIFFSYGRAPLTTAAG